MKTSLEQNNQLEKKIKFLPLGDSYTICEGATWEESWPFLLTRKLESEGIKIELMGNPAVTGYTTSDLIEKELPEFIRLKPDFVTLLIGVNDYVQEKTEDEFKSKIITILDYLQNHLSFPNKILLLTIPDYSVTPQGCQYAKGRNVTAGITGFNNIIQGQAKSRNLDVVDIFPSTLKMKNKPELIAKDGLHPSALEYFNWLKLIYPKAKKLLQE